MLVHKYRCSAGGLAILVIGDHLQVSAVFWRFTWLSLCSSFMWIAGFSLARAGGGIWLERCLVRKKSESSKKGEQQGMDSAKDWL